MRVVRNLTVRSKGFFRRRLSSSNAATDAAPATTESVAATTATLGIIENCVQTTTGTLPVTTELKIIDTQKNEKIPAFRVLDIHGQPLPDAEIPQIDKEEALEMYHSMVKVQTVDDIFYNAQRQGRISFYMQNIGEEATQVGSVSSLGPDDMIFAQYRELGVLLHRGYTIQEAADQCYGNERDVGKGRMMPVHYGSRKLNFQTISSPLTTQLPQAVGAGYSMKLKQSDGISVVYFGEGAASEGDFHAALNFASTLEVPMLFFCRNNGYAISTPTADQFRGDGIASRAAGYGMYTIRVDGNDLLAVKMATKAARELAKEKSRPVLIESMSYRGGHHSTSDDSTRYRSVTEIKLWQELSAVTRFRKYIESQGWWDEQQDQVLRDEERLRVLTALESAESAPKPSETEMFTDVYAEMPPHLIEQRNELNEHIKKYPGHYDLTSH